MADESDVGNALVALIAQACYPTGLNNASAVGFPVTVQRGWPVPGAVDAALARGQVIVSIYGDNGSETNVTRFDRQWIPIYYPDHTLAVTISTTTVTISGTVASPQNVRIAVGTHRETQKVAIYAVQPTDTLTSIATGLAALLVTAGVAATSSGAVVTLPSTANGAVDASVGGYGTLARELKRQQRTFSICNWCKSPAQRDAVAPVLDIALSRLDWLSLADGSSGRLIYQRTLVLDEKQKLQIYRRDLQYRIEYATIETVQAPEVLQPVVTVTRTY